jgi:hypothetical protein
MRIQSNAETHEGSLVGENPYVTCTPGTDTSSWNPKVARFFAYWLALKPQQGLPGRQHFDPLAIPDLMPRVWMLDVLREPLRYRYRLVGTKEVETLQREVTGMFFDEVHAHPHDKRETYGRFSEAVNGQIASYRKGNLVAIHKQEHVLVENCLVPMARDGRTVDLLIGFSVLYRRDGEEA